MAHSSFDFKMNFKNCLQALLSSLVFQQKVDNEPKLTAVLGKGVAEIKRVATKVAQAQQDCGMDMPVDEYLRTLHFGLVEVVYAWVRQLRKSFFRRFSPPSRISQRYATPHAPWSCWTRYTKCHARRVLTDACNPILMVCSIK